MSIEKLAEKLAAETGRLLQSQQLKLVTAESCTGGGLSYWLTSIPGSSAWFERGFVTYSDAAKSELLAVPQEIIAEFGAVSEQTARAMAEGAIRRSQSDISIAITGIAGPGGGSAQKPVGTVWIAYAGRHLKTIAEVNHFPGDRQAVRNESIIRGLEKLADILQKNR